MKGKLLITLLIQCSLQSFSQVGFIECQKSTPVFELAEKMPEPSGGMDSLKMFFQKEFISWNLNNQTRQLDIDLLINKDGSACPYMIHVAPGDLPTDKMMKSIIAMPQWKPALQNGYKVDCYARLSLQIDGGVLTKLVYKNSQKVRIN